MKFSTSLLLAPLVAATAALAQTIQIGAPTAWSSIEPGKTFTVTVDRPNSLQSSTEVAIVIALNPCPAGPCTSPASELGYVLYTGPFNPQYSVPRLPPHQNFTVTVPSGLSGGNALLSVTHLALIGAGPAPFLEFQNVTLNLA